jgi:D-sedoheptulose 7-phosphate isomerase
MQDITQALRDSAALKLEVAETQADIIQVMIDCVWDSLQKGGKVLLCGNGGSAADAQHLAAECMVRLQEIRAPLAALALTANTSVITAAGNDDGFDTIFARQVAGLGQAGDVLLALSTSGNSANVVRAVEAARQQGLRTIGMLGKGGGRLGSLVDIALVVPSYNTQRIQEVHLTVGHTLCEALEQRLLAVASVTSQGTTIRDHETWKHC